MDKDLISVIGELWKLGAIILASFIFIYFRKEIKLLIAKLNKVQVKSGDNQLVLSQDSDSKPEENSVRLSIKETSAGLQVAEKKMEEHPDSPDMEFWDAFVKNDKERLKIAFERRQASEMNAVNQKKNEILYYWCLYSLGETSALNNLNEILSTSEGSEIYPIAVGFIGGCYEKGNVFDKALNLYDDALTKVNSEQDIAEILTNKADCYFKMGVDYRTKAYELIKEKLESITDIEAKFTLYKGLAKLYKQSDEWLSEAFVLEKALAIHPDNNELRFDIAYAYGNTDFKDLSLLHYRILLRFLPDHSDALNNIGVEYLNQKLPILSTESYKKSHNKKNTLASSNLAYKLLDAGFVDEAKELLDEAMAQENPHENVATALAEITRRRQSEEKKESEIIHLATEKQRFILAFSSSYLVKMTNMSFEGTWATEQGTEVLIETKGDKINATWEENGKKYKLTGTVTNDSAIVTETLVAQSLLGYNEPLKGIAYLKGDGKQLEIVLFDKSTIVKKWVKKEGSCSE